MKKLFSLFLVPRFEYFSISVTVEPSSTFNKNEVIPKKHAISRDKKTGVVYARRPVIVLKKNRPKELFPWTPLTPESGAECLRQIRHLTDSRNTGTAAVEKVIRLKKEDFVAA